MLAARDALALAVGGIGLTVSVAVAASVLFAPPTVSVSSLTLKSTDSVGLVINWTKRCIGFTTCPKSWDVTVTRKSPDGYNQESRRLRTNLKDTVRVAKPVCWDATKPLWSDTMLIGVRAVASGVVERSNAGTAKLAVRCRRSTPAEIAEGVALADTFPKENRRLAIGDWAYKIAKGERDIMRLEQMRAAKTKADSTRLKTQFDYLDTTRNDSVSNIQGGTLVTFVGYESPVCWLGRNRYTGHVEIISGDDVACEKPRARMQAERSG